MAVRWYQERERIKGKNAKLPRTTLGQVLKDLLVYTYFVEISFGSGGNWQFCNLAMAVSDIVKQHASCRHSPSTPNESGGIRVKVGMLEEGASVPVNMHTLEQ